MSEHGNARERVEARARLVALFYAAADVIAAVMSSDDVDRARQLLVIARDIANCDPMERRRSMSTRPGSPKNRR